MKNKKVLLSLLVGLILIGGAVFGGIHQQQVKAERIAQEKQEALIKAEKKNLSHATSAVESAYKTRGKKEIALAHSAISKLDEKQKKDKLSLTTKMTALNGFIKQVSDVNTSLNKAIQSKSDKDIQATQVLIDKMTDSYLKSDKESAQKKLNDLKNKIIKAKADADAKVKAEEQANANTQTTDFKQGAQNNSYSGGSYHEPQYQTPEYQAPVDSTPQYQAPPAPPVNNTPVAPPSGGGSGGTSNNNHAQDTPHNVPRPTPPSNIEHGGIAGDGTNNGVPLPDIGW